MTQRQVRQIARESKRCCRDGHGMAVFADGSCMFSIGEKDVFARGSDRGGWEQRIAYVRYPLTIRRATERFKGLGSVE